MGIQFAVIYDIVVVAVLAGMVFNGAKKGFAAVVVGLVSLAAAFICAMAFKEPISAWVYDSIVEKPLEEAVDSELDSVMNNITLSSLSELDFEAVKISGVYVKDIQPNYEGTGKAIMDLSDVDLSGTGITAYDLKSLGFAEDVDFSSLNGKTAEFSMAEIQSEGLGKLAAAQVIAVKMRESSVFGEVIKFTDTVGQTLPQLFGEMSEEIAKGSAETLRPVVLAMINSKDSVKTAVIDGIIKPYFMTAAQTIAFTLIFSLAAAVLGIIAHALELVNKIPVLGSFNAFVGGIAGLAEGLLTICVVCLIVRFIISLSDGTMIFLNNMAIEETYLFKIFYNLDFLNLT